MAKVTESLITTAIHAVAKSMGYAELHVHQKALSKALSPVTTCLWPFPWAEASHFATHCCQQCSIRFVVTVSRFSTRSLTACSCSSDLEHGRHSQEFLSTVLNENDKLSATKLCKTASRYLFPGLLKQWRALGCVPRLHSTQSKHEVAMMLL